MSTLKNRIITRNNKIITYNNKLVTGCGSGCYAGNMNCSTFASTYALAIDAGTFDLGSCGTPRSCTDDFPEIVTKLSDCFYQLATDSSPICWNKYYQGGSIYGGTALGITTIGGCKFWVINSSIQTTTYPGGAVPYVFISWIKKIASASDGPVGRFRFSNAVSGVDNLDVCTDTTVPDVVVS